MNGKQQDGQKDRTADNRRNMKSPLPIDRHPHDNAKRRQSVKRPMISPI
jgi:hypothetical protein